MNLKNPNSCTVIMPTQSIIAVSARQTTLIAVITSDTIQNIGKIKAIDFTEPQDAIEIWVEDEDGPTCLYLFPYDSGIVQVGE